MNSAGRGGAGEGKVGKIHEMPGEEGGAGSARLGGKNSETRARGHTYTHPEKEKLRGRLANVSQGLSLVPCQLY